MALERPVFEVKESTDGSFYAHIQAVNGDIVWSAKGYNNEISAVEAIEWIVRVCKSGDYSIVLSETRSAEGSD